MLWDRLAAIKPVRPDSVEIITRHSAERRAGFAPRTRTPTNRGNRSSYSFPSVANFLIASRQLCHARVNTRAPRSPTMYRFIKHPRGNSELRDQPNSWPTSCGYQVAARSISTRSDQRCSNEFFSFRYFRSRPTVVKACESLLDTWIGMEFCKEWKVYCFSSRWKKNRKEELMIRLINLSDR